MVRTIDDLIGCWPSGAEFARDIDIKPNHLETMKVRRSIPVEYWPRIIRAAKKRGIPGITSDALMAVRAAERAARDARAAS